MSDAGHPPGGHPPDSPRLPRGKPSLLVWLYGLLGAGVVGTYLAASLFGWGYGDEQRDTLPASVRQAPGGYRSYHFWHSGYQGGK
jgi:hypothetical protein